ncbi:shikimate kinase [Striga asiatica]|uniref:Shikimate kinase n=1 Tax=Striga asiatica TaxID=4170 RepID=A0A5A7Q9E8_STRAF|nr:shikimate kinase [Striga asiatica]
MPKEVFKADLATRLMAASNDYDVADNSGPPSSSHRRSSATVIMQPAAAPPHPIAGIGCDQGVCDGNQPPIACSGTVLRLQPPPVDTISPRLFRRFRLHRPSLPSPTAALQPCHISCPGSNASSSWHRRLHS